MATCNNKVAGHGSSRFHSQDRLPIAIAPTTPTTRIINACHFYSLIYLNLYPVASHNHPKFTKCNCVAPKQSLNPTGPTVEWPSHIRISVGNSASRRLFAKNPSNGIISSSAPARPSVMTWARPFSVAATSSSNGFLKGSEHRLNRNKDGKMDNTDRSRKKE